MAAKWLTPMGGSYLLDTNVIIALFAGDAAVQDHLAVADEVYVPSIAIGVLCFGARKSGRPNENLARIGEFVASNVVLSSDTQTARRYGEVKDALRREGHPIPENPGGSDSAPEWLDLGHLRSALSPGQEPDHGSVVGPVVPRNCPPASPRRTPAVHHRHRRRRQVHKCT